MMNKTLDYRGPEPLPMPGLHLQDWGDRVRLIRLPRRWVQIWMSIVSPAIIAGILLVVAMGLLGVAWRVYLYRATDAALWLTILSLLILVYGGWTMLEMVRFLRSGPVPSVLEATAEGLEWRWPGLLRHRARRYWPAGEIEDVDLRQMRDVLFRRNVSELRIRIRGRWIPLTMRLSHEDPSFGDRTAAAFRRVLGMND